MPVLSFRHIDKSFQAVQALSDVSLDIEAGQVLGLIGENGAGKSTLMNVLGGVIQPDTGEMRLRGEAFRPTTPSEASVAGIAFIHQELNLFTNLSIRDNLFIDSYPRFPGIRLIRTKELRANTNQLLAEVGLDLDPNTSVDQLSPGERQLVEIAKALRLDARILIFDEPTTSLAAREKEHLFALIGRLRAEGRAIVYISHTLQDIRTLSDTVAVLRDGQIVDTGAVEDFDIERMIGAMVGRSLGSLFPKRKRNTGGGVVLRATGISLPGILKDVSLEVHEGEILGLFGLMGSGRTELAQTLFGIENVQEGEIFLDSVRCSDSGIRERIGLGMAFVTEDRRRDGLMMDASVSDNLSLATLDAYSQNHFRLVDRELLRKDVESVADILRIRVDQIDQQPVRNLSGGNQQKTIIGRWLLVKPKMFFLDEPTRGIDVGARQEVYTLVADLADKGAAILLISSEIEELTGMCDRILVMARGTVVGVFEKDAFDEQDILRAAFQEERPTT